MQIIVEIHEGEDGRPVGTVRSGDSMIAIPFSGNLEFLALIERLLPHSDKLRHHRRQRIQKEKQK